MTTSTPSESLLPSLSLLWPAGGPLAADTPEPLSATAADDLNVLEVVHAMVGGDGPPTRLQQRERFARQLLSQLCQQPDVIAYRQDVLEDLLNDRPLRERLGQLLPSFEVRYESAKAGYVRSP